MNPRQVLFSLLILCLPVLVGFGPSPTLVESDDSRIPIGSGQLQALAEARPPLLRGQAALIMDINTERVVYQRNGNGKLALASITKVMSAIVVLERADLNEQVTITHADLEEGSSMGLQSGDVVAVEQLLWGMLLPSGNDAAKTLARVVSGSVPKFVDMMNRKAQVLGLRSTQFMNPHGLDQDGHYSSAYDIAVMSRYAMRFPLFRTISASPEYTVVSNRTYTIRNTNYLVRFPDRVPGVNGVKTGYTDLAGDSLVASVDRGGHQILVVVMGTNNRSSAAAELIEYAYAHYVFVPLSQPVTLPATERSGLVPLRGEIMLPSWQQYYVHYAVEVAPIRATRTAAVGTAAPIALLTYYLGAQELGSLPVYRQTGG